jgi:hypothetical protein
VPRDGQAVSGDDWLADAKEIAGTTVVVQGVGSATPDGMRQLIDVLRRERQTRLALPLASTSEGKVQRFAGLSRDLVEAGLHAGS